MTISKNIQSSIEKSSWIRDMFSHGQELMKKHGRDQVFDFSIGNPVFEPPEKVKQAMIELSQSTETGMHRYMPNAGFPETRSFIAAQLKNSTDLSFTEDHIVMCVGAGGGLNVVFKTVTDPGDEVIVLAPYFMEYRAYVENYHGVLRVVETDSNFRIDFDQLEKHISSKTKAILINSPNNPTGVVYNRDEMQKLGKLLDRKSRDIGRNILLVSDEPYARICFDNVEVPSLFNFYDHSILVTSYSKDLALPGERIGYIAVSPKNTRTDLLIPGLITALRTLGFVNAPAFMQRLLLLAGDALVDLEPYRKNRDILHAHLTSIGFECVKPEGAFYLFPKSPIEDEVAFTREAMNLKLLLVPGRGFGRPGYFRVSYCFPTESIEKSLPIFTKLAERYF